MHMEGIEVDVKDDPGDPRGAKATHERAAKTHDRAAELHEESARLHELHAVEMDEMGYPERVGRAERIADRERDLAEQQRCNADKHRRIAQGEPAPED